MIKVKDTLDYLSSFNVGEELPAIWKVAESTGYERKTIREVFFILKGAGIIKITHGKPCVLLKDPLECEEHF